MSRAAVAVACGFTIALAILGAATPSSARSPIAGRSPVLVALAPAADAREAVAIGPAGEVYAPDGKGAWVRSQAVTTADRLAHAGRAGTSVVAAGGGAIYRLAPNGWSALRLAQKGKAVMSEGPRAVGAVGRQLYALDRMAGGEPAKLARAPAAIVAIGASPRGIVVATDRGLYRVQGASAAPIAKAPRQVRRLVSDRWALVDGGILDLRSLKTTRLPSGLRLQAAAVGPRDSFVAVATRGSRLELVTLDKGKLAHVPLPETIAGAPVGLVVDARDRVAIALADGRIALRDAGSWSVVEVRDALPPPRPGARPAMSR